MLSLYMDVGSLGQPGGPRGVQILYPPNSKAFHGSSLSASTSERSVPVSEHSHHCTLKILRQGESLICLAGADDEPLQDLGAFDLSQFDDTRGQPITRIRLTVFLHQFRALGQDSYAIQSLKVSCTDPKECLLKS